MWVLRVGWLVAVLARTAAAAPPPPSAAPTPGTATPAPARADTYALAWVRDEGAESCPTTRELAREVAARLGRTPFDDASLRSIEIRVERTPTGYRAHVLVRGDRGETLGRRQLWSDEPSCESLFSASALAVALLIDPDAPLEPKQDAVAEFEPLPSPVVVPAAPPPPAPPAPRACPACPSAPAPERRELGSASGLGGLAVGLVPESSAALALEVSARPDRRWGVSATALYVAPSEHSASGASVRVGLSALGLAVTFQPLANTESLKLEAGPWLGALHTAVPSSPELVESGLVTSDPGDLVYFGGSLGGSVKASVSTHVFVTARGLLFASFVRRELAIEQGTGSGASTSAIWTQPAVAGLFAAGLGWSFF